MKVKTKLSGGKCRCTDCGEYFRNAFTLDQHRVGRYDERRCLTPADMIALAFEIADSFWSLRRSA